MNLLKGNIFLLLLWQKKNYRTWGFQYVHLCTYNVHTCRHAYTTVVILQRGLAPRSKGKARAELRPARSQSRLPLKEKKKLQVKLPRLFIHPHWDHRSPLGPQIPPGPTSWKIRQDLCCGNTHRVPRWGYRKSPALLLSISQDIFLSGNNSCTQITVHNSVFKEII